VSTEWAVVAGGTTVEVHWGLVSEPEPAEWTLTAVVTTVSVHSMLVSLRRP
jgi:hypothetical protein